MKGITVRTSTNGKSHAVWDKELTEFLTERQVKANRVVSGLIILEAFDDDGVTPILFICPEKTDVVETTKELLKAVKEVFP